MLAQAMASVVALSRFTVRALAYQANKTHELLCICVCCCFCHIPHLSVVFDAWCLLPFGCFYYHVNDCLSDRMAVEM